MKTIGSTWRHRETQHLATGFMVTTSVWGDHDYIEVNMALKDRAGEAGMTARMNAQEARRFAAYLLDAADAAELDKEEGR